MKSKQPFFTKVELPKSDLRIDYQQSIFLIGSCFTEHIGTQLKSNKFNIALNPYGIVYNPISIVRGIKRVFKEQLYTSDELRTFNRKFFSFDHHSCFSNFDREICLKEINKELQTAENTLKKANTIIITLGSAWVYEYQDFGIVANCHKIPNKEFTKRLLSVKEIIAAFDEIKKELSGYHIIFTVSPVRHIKDGLHENNLSKATLLLAINNLINQNANYHYFPAYELVVDELRDYRFYKDDLVHPTTMAIDYVWERFINTYCDESTIELIQQLQKIKTAVNHKPFDFESEAHQQFIKMEIEQMDRLVTKYPFLDFEEEKKKISTF